MYKMQYGCRKVWRLKECRGCYRVYGTEEGIDMCLGLRDGIIGALKGVHLQSTLYSFLCTYLHPH